jgi:CheY-like chemotaxis protein
MDKPTTLSNDKQKKILVVKYEYDVALTLKTILEEEEQGSGINNKFEVDVFNAHKLALSNFKAGWYDLLLLAILMIIK